MSKNLAPPLSVVLLEGSTFDTVNIMRIMLEGSGFPAVAVSVVPNEAPHTEPLHLCITYAPKFHANLYAIAAPELAKLADGTAEVQAIADKQLADLKAQGRLVGIPYPESDLAEVRTRLLNHAFKTAESGRGHIVRSEPNFSAVPQSVTDAPTAPVKNPAGGGFDGSCQGADRFTEPAWRPAREVDDVSYHDHHRFADDGNPHYAD